MAFVESQVELSSVDASSLAEHLPFVVMPTIIMLTVDTAVPARPWPLISAPVYTEGRIPDRPNIPPFITAAQSPQRKVEINVNEKSSSWGMFGTKTSTVVRMKIAV